MTGFKMNLKTVLILMALIAPCHAMAADELCPDNAEQAKEFAPGNVAGVQADIERLNLCVDRAKLLKQLDDIAKERDATLRKVTDPAAAMVGMGGPGGIPSLSGATLPPLPTDVTGLKPGGVKITGAAANPLAGGPGAAAPAPLPAPTWKVRKIWGQPGGVAGATMRAQLTDGSGTLLNVAKGDALPDGRVIEAVSIKGVAVSQNGKITDLSWDDTPDGPVSGNGGNSTNALAPPPQ